MGEAWGAWGARMRLLQQRIAAGLPAIEWRRGRSCGGRCDDCVALARWLADGADEMFLISEDESAARCQVRFVPGDPIPWCRSHRAKRNPAEPCLEWLGDLPVVHNALHRGQGGAATVAVTGAGGESIWVEVRAAPIDDARASARCVVAAVRDVTAHMLDVRSLATTRDRLQMAQQFARFGLWEWDRESDTVTLSAEVWRILVRDPVSGTLPRQMLLADIHADDRQMAAGAFERAADGQTLALECRVRCGDGIERRILMRGRPAADDGEHDARLHGILQDITRSREVEERLHMLSLAVEQCPASVIITGVDGQIQYTNRKFTEVTGYTSEEMIGQTPGKLSSGQMPRATFCDLWKTIMAGREWRGEILNKRKNGEVFWDLVSISPIKDTSGRITHFLAIQEDISIRKACEARLVRQASYDDLTGLPNRTLAFDRLGNSLARARRSGQVVALLLVDLDEFKTVNDTLGHAAGDRLLQQAARRLERHVRRSDTVSRLGGDEFAIILGDLPQPRAAEAAVQKVHDLFREPFVIEGIETFVTASIGVSLFPADGTEASTMLKNADAAMYRSKKRGRNDYNFFSREIDDEAHERLTIVSHLRRALDRNELSLHYQPIVDGRNGRVVAVETLLRWQSPDLGFVPPNRFIPLAEETGLIVPIGEWVLRTACAQLVAWQEVLPELPRLAVNVSARQFRDEGLIETIADILRSLGLPPDRLELEITESLLLQDLPSTVSQLATLQEMGVRLSIDDFGTGYSSLSYLKRFRVQTLKVDRSFVNDVMTDPDDATLVSAIIAMAHRLSLTVVAEGVETHEQVAFLRASGCDLLQGYLFCRPQPPEQILEFLRPAVLPVAAVG